MFIVGISTIFYVIDDNNEIPYDGIIGYQFLSKNQCKIELRTKNLIVQNEIIPIFQQPSNYNEKVYIMNNAEHFKHEDTLILIDIYNNQRGTVTQFLVSTLSDDNIMKRILVSNDSKIDETDRKVLNGIDGKGTMSIGSAEILLFDIPTKFQVVEDDFPISCEGILGSTFLNTTKATIDFETNFLIVDEKYTPFRKRKLKDAIHSLSDFAISQNTNFKHDSVQYDVNVVTRAQKNKQENAVEVAAENPKREFMEKKNNKQLRLPKKKLTKI